MDVILIISIVVIMVILISATLLVMGNKYMASNYDQKMQDIVSQVNDVQKSSYNYTQKQGRQLSNNNVSLDSLSNDVNNLGETTTVIDENLNQLTLNYSSHVVNNAKDVSSLQKAIKDMPWDQQLLDTKNLQTRVGINETDINNINYKNAGQDADLQILKKYQTSSSSDIKTLQSGFSDLSGNYVSKSSLSSTLTNYPMTSKLNTSIGAINDSLTNISNSLNTIPKTYSTIATVSTVQGTVNQAQSDLTALKQRILNLENTYTSKSDLASAQLSTGQSTDKALNTALSSVQTSVANVVKQVSTIPSSFVDVTDYANLKKLVNNLNSSVLTLSNDRWITSADGANRLLFANNNRTYFGSKNGYEFRNSSDQSITTIDNGGNLNVGKFTANQICLGSTCISENDLKNVINGGSQNVNSIDGPWIAPCGWIMSIRNTAGGKSGQEDWGRTDGQGGFGYQANYQGNNKWMLTTHNWVFYLASDGRLVSDSGGNNDSYKFSRIDSIDGGWKAPCGWIMSIRNTANGKSGQMDWSRTDGGGGWQYQANYQGNNRWILTTHNEPFYLASDGRLVSDTWNGGAGKQDTYKFSRV